MLELRILREPAKALHQTEWMNAVAKTTASYFGT
jgi:hypothetical protein